MEWFSVETKLPNPNECVLFVEKHSRLVNYGFYEKIDKKEPNFKETPSGKVIYSEKLPDGVWWRLRFRDCLEQAEVTHWMPLPKPPIEI